DLPFSRAVPAALEETLGAPVIRMPSLGGSIPMHLFAQATGRPIVGFPIVNHDNNQHAADENLRLQNLWDGIESFAAVLARVGGHWDTDQPRHRSGRGLISPPRRGGGAWREPRRSSTRAR